MVAIIRTTPKTRFQCLKPVGYEIAICKRNEGAGLSLPKFWFMEDKAGTYKSIFETPRPPSTEALQAVLQSKPVAKEPDEPKQRPAPPAAPPSPPTSHMVSSQPDGAQEPSPKTSSWAKVAATVPPPLPIGPPASMHHHNANHGTHHTKVPLQNEFPELPHVPRPSGVTMLSDWMNTRTLK